MIQGRLQLKEYQTKDGQKRSEISILADTVQFMDGRPQQSNRLPDSCRQEYAQHNQQQRGNYIPPMPGASPYSAADRPPPRPPIPQDDEFGDDAPF